MKGTSSNAAADCMFNLKQGKPCVADRSVDFWVQTGGVYLHGFSDGMASELAAKDLPLSCDQLVFMCIKLNDHLKENRHCKIASAKLNRNRSYRAYRENNKPNQFSLYILLITKFNYLCLYPTFD